MGAFANIKGLTYYRDNEEDPYITLKEVRVLLLTILLAAVQRLIYCNRMTREMRTRSLLSSPQTL